MRRLYTLLGSCTGRLVPDGWWGDVEVDEADALLELLDVAVALESVLAAADAFRVALGSPSLPRCESVALCAAVGVLLTLTLLAVGGVEGGLEELDMVCAMLSDAAHALRLAVGLLCRHLLHVLWVCSGSLLTTQ